MKMLPWALAIVTLASGCQSPLPGPTESERVATKMMAEGRYDDALQEFSREAYDGGSYRALMGMALCYAQKGNQARFEAFALEASSAAPFEVEAHGHLGVLYVRGAERLRQLPASRRYAQIGVEYLRRVYAARPETPNILQNLGLGLHLAGDSLTAQLMLEQAYAKEPGRAELLHLLIVVHRSLGRRDRVRALLAPLAAAGDLPDSWRETWDWARSESSD